MPNNSSGLQCTQTAVSRHRMPIVAGLAARFAHVEVVLSDERSHSAGLELCALGSSPVEVVEAVTRVCHNRIVRSARTTILDRSTNDVMANVPLLALTTMKFYVDQNACDRQQNRHDEQRDWSRWHRDV